jgi:predicted membrane chloride channel (bestrophin family)
MLPTEFVQLLQTCFVSHPDTPPGLAHAWSQQLDMLENKTLNNIMVMERIRSSPLPLVYVMHLRIFLFVFFISLPYIWYPSWRWSTIPIVLVTSFAMLGLEGIAIEVEYPFRRDRPNHLDTDNFCTVALGTIQQTVCDAANSEIEKNRGKESVAAGSDGDDNEDSQHQEGANSNQLEYVSSQLAS